MKGDSSTRPRRQLKAEMAGWRSVLAMVYVGMAAVSCLDTTDPSHGLGAPVRLPLRPADVEGVWVAHVAGWRDGDHVEMFAVRQNPGSLSRVLVTTLPTSSWKGDLTADLPGQGEGSLSNDTMRLAFLGASPDSVLIVAALQNDTLTGVLSDAAGVHQFVGIRVDARVLAWDSAHFTPVSAPLNGSPRVVLRLDDAPYSDREFVARMLDRHLVGEIAVPTHLIGAANRLSWQDLAGLSGLGFGLAAHSRFHVPSTRSPSEFLFEVVGSLNDLAVHGLATGVFVQPGSWRDSLNFDSVAKIENWHGALMRSVSVVFENYIDIGSVTPTDSLRWRLGSLSISDGIDSTTVLERWQAALRPDRITVFQVHSISLAADPDHLNWFLDSLQAARRTGRIQLYGSTADALSGASPYHGGLRP